ncbi:hypothetical protein BKP37_09680 [Anaerobacillus alkalilacustris]|uniref:Nbr1 FW domain-containing protein n=1 Tax=Anaerobacillus alkalilacustris TaxID=393763 RepID=A0A1S2LMY1_9BACI|nr:NBR1-Ig-like domain-containing protein [Anaerobacillus alkalilacustris]OIJ13550.1 hypothetical protein BKP37_09680 [Anaerobacillus alkalilacustris]
MNFSEFSKRLYKNLSGLNSQGHFIGALFNAAGSSFFVLKPPYGTDGYQRKVFSGTRDFTQDMKDSFPKPLDTDGLMLFFQSRIGEKTMTTIMKNFGIPESEHQNKDLFIKALCKQFQTIVSEVSDEVDDIVASEYSRLLRKSGAEITNNAPYYPGDNILIVSRVPEHDHNVSFYKNFEHQWTIRNTGTVTWEGRYLECTNQSDLRIRAKNKIINIPKVKPGDDVCLTAAFNARGFEGRYEALWEMKDTEGRTCFNDQKAIKVVVKVVNTRSETMEA